MRGRRRRRETLECELREVRSTIRSMPEAPEVARSEQGALFQLERAEEQEIRLLEALAALDANPD